MHASGHLHLCKSFYLLKLLQFLVTLLNSLLTYRNCLVKTKAGIAVQYIYQLIALFQRRIFWWKTECLYGMYEDVHLLWKIRIFIQINMPFTLKNLHLRTGDTHHETLILLKGHFKIYRKPMHSTEMVYCMDNTICVLNLCPHDIELR